MKVFIKSICFLFIAMVFLTVIDVSYSQTTFENPIAQIFGKDIFLSDLNPTDSELKMMAQSNYQLSDDNALKARAQKLSFLIWTSIMDEFAKSHAVEPTEEEIQSYAKAMNTMKTDLPPEFAEEVPQLSPEMEKEIYKPFVKSWKISKTLYEEYGGVVIFQQANPMEPVGAYRKLLESHEAKGDFKIYDEQLKQLFWENYVRKHPFQIPPDEVDYSKPWWLKESVSNTAK